MSAMPHPDEHPDIWVDHATNQAYAWHTMEPVDLAGHDRGERASLPTDAPPFTEADVGAFIARLALNPEEDL